MIRLYELTYLISPDLLKENLKEISGKINNLIVQENGVLERETEPVKVRLAYPIKKKMEAFLITFIFQLNSEKLEKLEKKLKDESQILRYIVFTVKRSKKTRRRSLKKPRTQDLTSEEITKPIIKPQETPKVELKEIDKKIEEILKE